MRDATIRGPMAPGDPDSWGGELGLSVPHVVKTSATQICSAKNRRLARYCELIRISRRKVGSAAAEKLPARFPTESRQLHSVCIIRSAAKIRTSYEKRPPRKTAGEAGKKVPPSRV